MTKVLAREISVVSIDARGPRFAAGLTTIVLACALVTSNIWIVITQAVIFAIGAVKGPQFTPYALVFRRFVRPLLKSAATFEDVRPPQFAQSVGLLFALAAVVGNSIGIEPIFTIAVSFALAAAFLNAVFNFCLGCELYLLLLRVRLSYGQKTRTP